MNVIGIILLLLLVFQAQNAQNVLTHIEELTYDDIKKNLMFAYSAYCPSEGVHGILDWKCWWCQKSGINLQNISVFLDKKSQLMIYLGTYEHLSGKTELIIGFRGTPDPFFSIVTLVDDVDFRFVKNPYGKGRIMKGFFECFEFIESQSIQLVEDFFKKEVDVDLITITGHSLGSNIADLALIRFIQEIENVRILRDTGNLRMIHFGSPRTGDSEFVDFFLSQILSKEHIFRVTFENDVAPHFPPKKIIGYHHIPTEVFINSVDDSFVICDGSGEDSNCSDSFQSIFDLSYRKHFEYLGIKLIKGAYPPHWCIDSG